MKLAELKNEALSFDRAELRDVFIDVGVTKNQTQPRKTKKHNAVFNLDKRKVSAIVSDRYNIVQHRDIVNAVVDGLTNLNIQTKALVKDGGDRLFIDLEFENTKLYVQEGEEFIGGIRVINSYDKTTGIIVAPRLLRLACSNGMVVQKGLVDGIQLKHTTKLKEDFEKTVAKMIKDMVDNCDKLKAMVNDCIGDSIEWELMDDIILKLVVSKKHFDKIKERMKGNTRWDLYNAFTNYATFDDQIKPYFENLLQNKAQKVLTTPLVQLLPKEH